MKYSPAERGLFLVASITLLLLGVPRIASAQGADSSASLVGALMIDANAGAWLSPGPQRSFSATGAFQSFVTEHWQVGLAPAFSASTGSFGSSAGVGLDGIVNYMVGAGRARWFVGATAGASGSGGGGGGTFLGAQTGALWFLAPTTALRTELRSRRMSWGGSFTAFGAFLTLDSYLPAGPRGATTSPDLGAVDVSLDASLGFNGERARTINVTLAPFLTRWAQVGGKYSAISVPWNGDWPTAQHFNGFARLYAPLGPRAMPFVEGFVEKERFAQTIQPPATVGATAGVRHYLNNGIALDAGLRWRRIMAQSFQGFTVPAQNLVLLQAGIVTELRLR